MFLYLVRHGEAKNKDEDPERALSDKGINDVKKVAEAVPGKDVKLAVAFHSGKARAKQTAEIIAEVVSPPQGVSQKDGLSPHDDPDIWVNRLKDMNDDVMLVGHLPHLESLASTLLGSIGGSFSAGQIMCLERDNYGKWSKKWTVAPENVT